MPDELHVLPVADLVDHELSEECICGPKVSAVFREDGSNGWVVNHWALDRREATENVGGGGG